ncbi:MAG: nucleotidyltransferase domain-containing protein, partial [Elusimicrobia bacterium]|nr:nucleotidyltransferase domain-containing protein [Elusimicrobiota bacterium]
MTGAVDAYRGGGMEASAALSQASLAKAPLLLGRLKEAVASPEGPPPAFAAAPLTTAQARSALRALDGELSRVPIAQLRNGGFDDFVERLSRRLGEFSVVMREASPLAEERSSAELAEALERAGAFFDRAVRTKPSFKERLHYAGVCFGSLHFYLVTNIVNKWGRQAGLLRRLRKQGQVPAVSRQRSFFAHMRVMGQTGEFRVLGYVPRDNQAVIKEARQTFRRFFDAPGIGQREIQAYERFLGRLSEQGKEASTISNFRKRARYAMFGAALLPAGQVADYLDGLSVEQDRDRRADFGQNEAPRLLEGFRQVVLEELAKEPADDPGRVVGVVLIGSFASGTARPGSDFDS